jgi:hypothetical protein
MARRTGRSSDCSRTEGLTRLDNAERFVFVAELVIEQEEYPGVAAALAVLAGIAASDAACCARLGRRHRGQDHGASVDLLATVAPGGPEMAKDLGRLLQRKDDARYGMTLMPPSEALRMVGWAKRLVDRARSAMEA